MKPYINIWDKWFGKKITITLNDANGEPYKRRVSKKWFDLNVHKQSINKIIKAHVLYLENYKVEDWILHKDVDIDTYNEFRDENGFIFVIVHYEDGKPNYIITKKEIFHEQLQNFKSIDSFYKEEKEKILGELKSIRKDDVSINTYKEKITEPSFETFSNAVEQYIDDINQSVFEKWSAFKESGLIPKTLILKRDEIILQHLSLFVFTIDWLIIRELFNNEKEALEFIVDRLLFRTDIDPYAIMKSYSKTSYMVTDEETRISKNDVCKIIGTNLIYQITTNPLINDSYLQLEDSEYLIKLGECVADSIGLWSKHLEKLNV